MKLSRSDLANMAAIARCRFEDTASWETVVQTILVEADRHAKTRRVQRGKSLGQQLKATIKHANLSVAARVVMLVSERTQIPVHAIQAGRGNRSAHVVRARWISMWVLRELAFSLEEVAAALGLSDHTSVLNGLASLSEVDKAEAHAVWLRVSPPQKQEPTDAHSFSPDFQDLRSSSAR